MNIKPQFDYVVLDKPFAEEKSAGGIIVATGYGRPNRAKVIAVGPGRRLKSGKHVPMSVKVGDTVLFNAYADHHEVPGGEERRIIREQDVFAVVEG